MEFSSVHQHNSHHSQTCPMRRLVTEYLLIFPFFVYSLVFFLLSSRIFLLSITSQPSAAEARRAKILAREKDRLLAAKGEKKFEAVSSESVDDSTAALKKERPLAARRNRIAEAAKEKKEEGSEDSPKKIEVPKKTIDEINAEIKANTQKFDADVLAKPKEDSVKKEVVASKEEKKSNAMATSTMMGVVRLILLLVFGACIGYRSALSPGSRMEKIKLLENPSYRGNGNGVDEDGAQQALFNKISGDSDSGSISGATDEDSTGVGLVPWILSYGEGLLEGGFFGASIVWSVSSMLKRPLEKSLGTRSPNSSGIIALLLSIYNHGFQGIFDSMLTSSAEIVLYMLVIVVSGAAFSQLLDVGDGGEQSVINEL